MKIKCSGSIQALIHLLTKKLAVEVSNGINKFGKRYSIEHLPSKNRQAERLSSSLTVTIETG